MKKRVDEVEISEEDLAVLEKFFLAMAEEDGDDDDGTGGESGIGASEGDSAGGKSGLTSVDGDSVGVPAGSGDTTPVASVTALPSPVIWRPEMVARQLLASADRMAFVWCFYRTKDGISGTISSGATPVDIAMVMQQAVGQNAALCMGAQRKPDPERA